MRKYDKVFDFVLFFALKAIEIKNIPNIFMLRLWLVNME